MTVIAKDNSLRFHGASSTGPFTWTWRFLENTDIRVYRIAEPNENEPAQEVRVLLTEGLDYTLTGAGSYTGGSLTLTAALVVGMDLLVERYTESLQKVSIRNQGNNFRPEVHEDVFDRLTMIAQDEERERGTLRGLIGHVSDMIANIVAAGSTLLENFSLTFKPLDIITKGPWVDARAFATVEAADAFAVAQNKTLLISTQWAVPVALTLNSAVQIIKGGGFSGGGAININGSAEIGLYPVFFGDGSVLFGPGSVASARPEWWAATDDVQIRKALASWRVVELVSGKIYTALSSFPIAQNGQTLIGNGAEITAAYEQSASPSYLESLFYVTAHNVAFRDLKLTYTGTFDFGDYGGYLSAIHVEDSENFRAENVEASGWNRAGINIATLSAASAYCKNPQILNCNLHHNRVAGVIFGNTAEGLVKGGALTFNGIVTGGGTGYGFAGWSGNIPRNTRLIGINASDNFRKGLDFHNGENGTITGNTCARNRIYGIYAMGVRGAWVISSNTISDMSWNNEFPTISPYGIRVGHLVGQGLTEIPTSFVVANNTITNLTKTAGEMFVFGDSGVGLSYGKFTFIGNIVDVGTVSQIHNSSNGVSGGVEGNYFDISFIGNQIAAQSLTSTLSPFYVRSGKNRAKVFSDNTINIAAVTSTAGFFGYDSTVINGRSLVAVGNILNVPATTWGAVYDPINVKRVVYEIAVDNLVNGVKWRDWDGTRFLSTGAAVPASNYWSVGSAVWNSAPVGGGALGWVCTVAGSPGTWKAMANLAA